ncbi:hypothetical protein [Sphingomonas rubra]|uniref:Uncharacterized protein n=1 Tax=Sphingomonas rubra TaxID=634430 RepID=A0A1I5UFF6_9SPHN|nr:hypothetical protein [Sphingomonas rubra]SFP93981.1 hypothetical protein SAMN04488241_111139 [Sphingomonas rubra]
MVTQQLLKRLGLASLLVGFGLSTAACTDGYGYSGVGVGVAGGYADPYYGGYGNGLYGDPYYAGGLSYGGVGSYYGWYNNFYYPGTGAYVYDRYRRPHRWNAGQRRYWEGRRGGIRNDQVRDNWADFRRDYRNERRDYRGDLRDNRRAFRDGTINRDQFRQGRQEARREFRRDVREDYRQTRQENRAISGNTGTGGPRAGGWRGGGPRAGGVRGGGLRGGARPNVP